MSELLTARSEQPESSTGIQPARLRLAIVVSHPIQHFCPMYRSIAADGRVELLVIFAESGAAPRFDSGFGRVIAWQADILEGYEHTVVNADASARCAGVVDKLRDFNPDVIYIHGYAVDYLRAAMRWANQNKIPVMMTTDSEMRSTRPLHIRAFKRLALPPILRGIGMFLTVGDENERYFAHYGAEKSRFHRVPFSIDSRYYDKVLANVAEVRRATRQKLDIPENAVAILTVGKLIPRKRQADLVQGFAKAIQIARTPAVLLIAGDGPDRKSIEEIVQPIAASVRMLGFIGVDTLPEYYCAADIYVHPSDFDPHPLAISEACYCSLPIVVSDRIGSVGPTDDVQEGRNGWVYPVGNVNELAATLARLIDDPALRAQAGQISRENGLLHDVDRCGTLFVDGAFRAFSNRQSK